MGGRAADTQCVLGNTLIVGVLSARSLPSGGTALWGSVGWDRTIFHYYDSFQ